VKKLKKTEINKEKEDCSIEELLKIAKENSWKYILGMKPDELKNMTSLCLSHSGKKTIMKY